MSDCSEDDVDLPSAQECEKRCQEFASVTGTDTALAMFYLQDRSWNLQASINAYFEEKGIAPDNTMASSSKEETKSESIDKEPHRIRLLTWNIDGLDSTNLQTRTTAVCNTILKENPDVVFLQEVVPKTLQLIEEKCPQYSTLPGGDEGYFTAILLKCSSVVVLKSENTPFYTSVMSRNLLTVQANVKGLPIKLMTSHLESTATHTEERSRQLRTCFKRMQETEQNKSVIFGGDLNLRDKELAALGGIPDGIVDLWEYTGRRPEAKFTWDTRRNDNLSWDAKFRPQCRFDRLYLKPCQKAELKPVYFELIGIERIKECSRFPSDHWGILAHFDILSRIVKK